MSQQSPPSLVLASASPRRAELLRQVGLSFERFPVTVDERLLADEDARAATTRLAAAKARAALAHGLPEGTFVLACDTLVACDGTVFGKPREPEDAERMLAALAGRWHDVVSGVAFARAPEPPQVACAVTRVRLATLTRREIRRYVDGGEPMDKAGAYAIQGAGTWFVEEVRGSVTNVIGLPLELLRTFLARAGHPGPTLRASG